MQIRALDRHSDLDAVVGFYKVVTDYWELAEGRMPGPEKAKEFFQDVPPGCDAEKTHHVGLFLENRLSGLAELSFGFPEAGDAYLGLMILAPWARNAGRGAVLLRHIEGLARDNDAKSLYLAVMTINPKGRAFWEREGFSATGLSGLSIVGDMRQELHRLVKQL